MLRHLFVPLFAFASVLASACGSTSSKSDGGGAGTPGSGTGGQAGAASAGAGGGGAAGSGGVGGVGGTAGASGGATGGTGVVAGATGLGGVGGASASPRKMGSVYIGSAPDPTTSSATTAGADFILYPPQDSCTYESHGPCALAICGTPNPQGYLSAGTVVLSSDVMTQQVSQLINGTYESLYFPGDLWSAAGVTVTVSAPGGDVPAFSAQFPAPAVLAIPDATAVAIETAKHGQDIALTWQGGGACQAIFEFSERQGDTTYDAVCAFPSSDDSGTIPAAALAPFPAGTAPTYTFTCTVTTNLMVGDWAINIRALADARTPAGNSSEGAISLW